MALPAATVSVSESDTTEGTLKLTRGNTQLARVSPFLPALAITAYRKRSGLRARRRLAPHVMSNTVAQPASHVGHTWVLSHVGSNVDSVASCSGTLYCAHVTTYNTPCPIRLGGPDPCVAHGLLNVLAINFHMNAST